MPVAKPTPARPSPSRAALAWLGVALLAALAAPARAEPARESAKAGVHTLYLVRHGAYDEDDPADPTVGRHLVPLGRNQARRVGDRLAALLDPIDALYQSPMTRARETAEIVGQRLRLKPETVADLAECTPPSPALKPDRAARPEEAEACREQLDRAVARLLTPSPGRDRADVVVAHGNVIRYFVCRALGVPPEAWLGFAATHTGLTVIEVHADGTPKVVAYNDSGHLPPEMQTRGGKTQLQPRARVR